MGEMPTRCMLGEQSSPSGCCLIVGRTRTPPGPTLYFDSRLLPEKKTINSLTGILEYDKMRPEGKMTKTSLITLFVFLLGNFQTFQPANVPTPQCEFDFACTADCDPVWWGTAPQFRLICQVVVIDYYNIHYTFLAD